MKLTKKDYGHKEAYGHGIWIKRLLLLNSFFINLQLSSCYYPSTNNFIPLFSLLLSSLSDRGMGVFMQKEELIYLHTILVQVKRHIESEKEADFSGYEALRISPVHVHRSKSDHMKAIFTLGEEIGHAINPGKDMPVVSGKKERLSSVKEKELAGLKA
jgi:hypothetical protein